MSLRICLSSNTFGYPEGGGHAWVCLNWALGIREAGAEVIWLETIGARMSTESAVKLAENVKERLAPFGLDRSLVLWRGGDGVGGHALEGYPGLDAAEDADLLLNFQYGLPSQVVRRFRRSALIDIDPGLLQVWASRGEVRITPHDFYFTIGETVGHSGPIPDLGLTWHYAPPAVCLGAWPVTPAPPDAPFSTVSQWYSNEYVADANGDWYPNDKRTGFLPFIDLPKLTSQPLELALYLGERDEAERADLVRRGWHIRHSPEVSSSPAAYQRYIQQSRGEFSCVKPSCIKLKNAWISDRTLCYLASGKPAVVQDTGPSRFLPDRHGLLRFRSPAEAAQCLDLAASDYVYHSQAARALAAEFFDAKKVVQGVLNRALSP